MINLCGKGMEKSPSMAKEWMDKAVIKASAGGQNAEQGQDILSGKGVERSYLKANKEWWEKAAEQSRHVGALGRVTEKKCSQMWLMPIH